MITIYIMLGMVVFCVYALGYYAGIRKAEKIIQLSITRLAMNLKRGANAMDELKNCPFCGGEAEKKSGSHFEEYEKRIVEVFHTTVRCSNMGCTVRPRVSIVGDTPKQAEQAAIAAWETRANGIVLCKDCSRRLTPKGKPACDICKNFGHDGFGCTFGQPLPAKGE